MKISEVTFTLAIKSGNAALVEDHRSGLARILRELANRIERGADPAYILDANGNLIGSATLTVSTEDEED